MEYKNINIKYENMNMERENINIKRNSLLKILRKGKPGRPYKGISNYSRLELNFLRDEKLKIIMKKLNYNN